MPLPHHLAAWAIACLKEHVDLNRYQPFNRVSVSCKNNGKTTFARLLFETKIYNSQNEVTALPVCYMVELNKGVLKGNRMEYDLGYGNGQRYCDVHPVFHRTIKLKGSKFAREKIKLYNFIRNYEIPLVGSPYLTSSAAKDELDMPVLTLA